MSNHGNSVSEEQKHEVHHGYGFFVTIWVALIALTCLTVAVAGVDMGVYTVALALLIACIKAMLVMNYFMHIKFDSPLVKQFIVTCGVVLFLILMLLSSDVFIGRMG